MRLSGENVIEVMDTLEFSAEDVNKIYDLQTNKAYELIIHSTNGVGADLDSVSWQLLDANDTT